MMNKPACRILFAASLLGISAGAMAAAQPAEPAQRANSLADRISASEFALFGSSADDRPLLERVYDMEIRLYGRPQSWSLPQAIEEIERTIQYNPGRQPPVDSASKSPRTFQAYSSVPQFAGSRGNEQSSGEQGKDAAQKELNRGIVGFCSQRLGQTVGGGECANLVEEAFRATGAKPEREFQEAPAPGDYVWGDLVFAKGARSGGASGLDSLAAVRPGDIVQLSSARFDGKTADGRGRYSKMTMGRHTAVVASIRPDGQTISVYEQNMNGNRVVTMGEYNLSDLSRGWIRIYRPVPN